MWYIREDALSECICQKWFAKFQTLKIHQNQEDQWRDRQRRNKNKVDANCHYTAWDVTEIPNVSKSSVENHLTSCAGNWLRAVTSDRTVHSHSSLSFRTRRYDRRYHWIEMIEKWQIYYSFCLCIWLHLNIFKTEKILQILGQKIPAQEVKGTLIVNSTLPHQLKRSSFG